MKKLLLKIGLILIGILILVLVIYYYPLSVEKLGEVGISSYYEEPESLNKPGIVILESETGNNTEYIEIDIRGEIYDFKYISLLWDNDRSEIVEDKIINSFDKLKDQIVIIKTILPEGVPIEKIEWKSSSGKKYEYLLGYDAIDETVNRIYKID